MKMIEADTIFTNVAETPDGDVWWEGMTETPPPKLNDWQGREWTPEIGKNQGRPAAHANSRFTVSATRCPSLDPQWDDPNGVPISAFMFGGRRSDTAPLVVESLNWEDGVYKAATLGSETTAAIAGKQGVVRRDPMAMIAFVGYNMGDYFKHWLKLGKSLKHAPKIFQVNWFRKNAEGKFVWPGFGENMRVLQWVVERCRTGAGKPVHASQTALGFTPDYADLHWQGVDFGADKFASVTSINHGEWQAELKMHDELFKKLEGFVPAELLESRRVLETKLAA